MNVNSYKIDLDELDVVLRQRLSESRYAHTIRVRDFALQLAKLYGGDIDKVKLAAMFHDYCKDGETPGNNLAHAGLAADILHDEFGVDDEDVVNAVRYHTTGRAGMSLTELIIFLADTLEPGRDYTGADRLRELVLKDLYAGALQVLVELDEYVEKNGYVRSEDTIAAIDWIKGVIPGLSRNPK